MSNAVGVIDPPVAGYLTIWCRLESGGYWLYRSRPAQTALRLVQEYNELVEPGRRYFAFPMGFNAKILGLNDFAPVLLQAMEDQLQFPKDEKLRRIKDEIFGLAVSHHGMTENAITCIEKEISAVYELKRGGHLNVYGD